MNDFHLQGLVEAPLTDHQVRQGLKRAEQATQHLGVVKLGCGGSHPLRAWTHIYFSLTLAAATDAEHLVAQALSAFLQGAADAAQKGVPLAFAQATSYETGFTYVQKAQGIQSVDVGDPVMVAAQDRLLHNVIGDVPRPGPTSYQAAT